jgi:predicted RNA-binding protein with TRAM domain
MGIEELVEGETYEMKVTAKDPRGEGIGRIYDTVVFVRNIKTRIGKTYRIKVTNLHKTFAYAESLDNSKSFIGNGSLIL